MSLQAESASVSPVVLPGAPAAAESRAFPYYRRLAGNGAALAAGYAVAWVAAFGLAGGLRWWLLGEAMLPEWSWLIVVLWMAGTFCARLLPGWGLGSVEETRRTVLLWLAILGATASLLFLFKVGAEHSRLTVILGFLFGAPLLLMARSQVKRLLIRLEAWGLPTVIYGAALTGRRILDALRAEKGLGFHPVGFFDDNPALRGARVEGLPVIGGAEEYTRGAPVAILAIPSLQHTRAAQLLEGPLARYRKVIVIPDLFDAPSLWVASRDLLGTLGLEIANNLEQPGARFVKRAADLTLALLSAPLWLPTCLVGAALVAIFDPGGPFFFQERIGRGGRAFRIWKLRTMHADAEAILERRLTEDPELRREWEAGFKLRDDPRVGRLGRWLRRLSIDELPQLINVLRGEMSLVGPRPLPDYHHRVLPERVRRLRDQVRPGITGLWQVSGRSELGTSGMERWDPYYVRNWSPWLDIVILVRTLRAVLHGTGAR